MHRSWIFILISLESFSVRCIQINFHLTTVSSQNNQPARHYCLEVPTKIRKQSISREIISYCLTEDSHTSTFNINQSHDFSSFTFSELAEQNITSQHLYSWSASIDLIEQYQHYLDQPDQYINNEETDLFYNCTWPRFGPTCQYTFNHLESTSNHSYTSLSELVNDYYQRHPYTSTTLICYEHLKCDRGPAPACLDWTEICDGKIDCADGGQDEEQCWQVEINRCDDDEYRCLNGRCIHRIYHADRARIPECIDASDESTYITTFSTACIYSEPTLACEDTLCRYFGAFTGHGAPSICETRQRLLTGKSLFSVRPTNLSDDCWFALTCRYFADKSFNTHCEKYCFFILCAPMISKHCPPDQSVYFLPTVPVLFSHMQFLYTRQQLIGPKMSVSPDFICLDKRFCTFLPGNNTIQIDHLTCYSAESVSFLTYYLLPYTWTQRYLWPAYEKYVSCAALPDHYYHYCDEQHAHLYRCINTSKCISKYRLLDKVRDCFYNDDEQMESVARFINLANDDAFFHCASFNTFISHRLVADGRCDCPSNYSEVCDDEETETKYALNHILFQTICDGFTDLAPVMIEGRWMTDETDCQNWLCDNIYTQCDTIWNCLDGRDEVNCNLSSSLSISCSSDSRSCVSPITNELFCLSVSKVNDGQIDCLGATDEALMCRAGTLTHKTKSDNFYCDNRNMNHTCLNLADLCSSKNRCEYADDQRICRKDGHFSPFHQNCVRLNSSITTAIEQHFCERFTSLPKPSIVHFATTDKKSMDQQSATVQEINPVLPQPEPNAMTRESRCHRGLELRNWKKVSSLINDSPTVVCLCPPSYYGSHCQYQNQRITLTLQFLALSDAWQTTFVIIALLIDHTHHRHIHSTRQLIYLPYKDCQIRFNINLLFASRPFDASLNYSIHFDIFEQHSHHHRASYLTPIIFPFLPVYHLALLLDIPRLQSVQSCTDIDCGKHGRCLRYARVFHSRSSSLQSFCQCDPGWAGRLCTIQIACSCAPGARCLGTLMNTNRSICLCPSGRFGPRCYLSKHHMCQNDGSGPKCLNGGRCIPDVGEGSEGYSKYTCQCRDGFTGDRCQYNQTQLIISFDSAVIKHLSQSMLVHFIRSYPDHRHENASTFKLIPFDYAPVSIYWSHPFHVVFVEFHHHRYYLTFVRPIFNQSEVKMETMIRSSDRCPHIRELLAPELVQSHLLYRIKFYHLLCQSNKTLDQILCFYDDVHLCLCQPSPRNGDRREANCFEYDHNRKFDCLGQNACENGGQCFQDSPTCPQTSVCMCRECSYGRRCQFTMDGFRLSLDAILGYHIQPHVSLRKQPLIVNLALGLVIIMVFTGIVNGVLSLITFNNKKLCEVGCAYYFLGSSITTLATMLLFLIKFMVLLTNQMGILTNQSLLILQCRLVDYLLGMCLNLDQWFNAFVSLERAFTIFEGINFNKQMSVKRTRCIITMSVILVLSSTIYDPINRHLMNDNINTSSGEDRIWCVVSYPKWLRFLDSFINMGHFCIPFLINIISAVIIIWRSARSRRKTHAKISFRNIFREQLRQHKHILIGPIVIVILSVPRLILAIVSGCMKSSNQSQIYLVAYFISFVPALLSFVIFVLPSKLYKREFQRTLEKYRKMTRSAIRVTRHFIESKS